MSTHTDNAEEPQSSSIGQPNFVQLEHQILEWWKREQSFEKRVAQLKGKPLFRFLDGPITANNPMGVHHAWGRALKDIFVRYHCLNGFDCQFQNGFDCQGLWVEVEVEKELGFKGKPDIEAFGLDKFSQACKARIDTFSKIQTEQSIRLGQWMDWGDSYYTHIDKNIEGIWCFLKKCFENGWLYRSGLPMPWCTRCGTSLSEHEMAGSYKTLKHLAIYVKILVPALQSRILVWTTTPWTLPANTGLAVNPKLEYAQVKVEGEELPLILSADVLKSWAASSWKKKKHELLRTWYGKDLAGLDYEPIFADLPIQSGFKHQIVVWEDVDPSEGTGVVHTAPGCGREDFELSKKIDLQRLTPVDEKGDYVSGYGFLEGKNAKQVAPEIAQYLKQHAKLFSQYNHEHSYPVCWRCKDELIFRLVDEWYISTEKVRPVLLKASAQVLWQPEHIGKRMENWLQNMGDWCISRKRYWGLPLPFYSCSECGTLTVIGSREELQRLSPDDLSKVPELHRPWIDTIRIACPKCNTITSRVSEVGDCWLDAGIVPYTTRGCYDKTSQAHWEPADWICEMSEQVRLWFYSMLFMGATLSDRAPYKRVLTYERVLAEDGSKFSKTGYMIKFDEAAEKMGVDTMRYYFASQPPTGDIRFGYQQGDETRRHLIALWNVHAFFSTYAKIDQPDLENFKDVESKLLPTDRWLLASLYDVTQRATRGYEEYSTHSVIRDVEVFLDGLSNWYIRSNRRRFWKSGSSDDKLAGYWSLLQAIRTCCVILSPIIPFVSEKIWQDCVRRYDPSAPESVHHTFWPDLPAGWADEQGVREVAQVREVINLALRLRAESKVKVRQPLASLALLVPAPYRVVCERFKSVILSELNVKDLRFLDSKDEIFSEYVELDLKRAGPVLKGDIGKAVTLVNALSTSQSGAVAREVSQGKSIQLEGLAQKVPAEIFVVKSRAQSGMVACDEQNLFLALDTKVTPELEHEGWVRELLRHTQVLRKESGLNVDDRIELSLVTLNPEIRSAVERFRTLIEDETLCNLQLEPLPHALGKVEYALPKAGDVTISLSKRT